MNLEKQECIKVRFNSSIITQKVLTKNENEINPLVSLLFMSSKKTERLFWHLVSDQAESIQGAEEAPEKAAPPTGRHHSESKKRKAESKQLKKGSAGDERGSKEETHGTARPGVGMRSRERENQRDSRAHSFGCSCGRLSMSSSYVLYTQIYMVKRERKEKRRARDARNVCVEGETFDLTSRDGNENCRQHLKTSHIQFKVHEKVFGVFRHN